MPDLRAVRQPRLGWIGTADHVIPPAAQLAMAHHAQTHIVTVDASTCRGSPTRRGDSPNRRRCRSTS